MYNRRFKSILLSGVAVMAAFGAADAANAAGTVAGTTITNQASVSYTVGGTPQAASSNVATFVVDKKVNLTVAMVGTAATQTALGATDQVTTFTVTNLTNSVQDFGLQALQSPITSIFGSANFAVTNLRAYVDKNGNGTYDPGVDTATYLDELAPDSSATVFIVANVPNVAGEATAVVELRAFTETGGTAGTEGSLVTATLLGDTPGSVDTVFADAAGPVDLTRDGAASAADAYVISTAAVTLVKSSTVVSDPYDLTVLPKAIPGATIKYCIVVQNAGPGTATAMTVTDVIPTNMTFVPGSITVGGTALGGTCLLDGPATGGTFDTTTQTVRGAIASILPLTAQTVTFQATIN